MTAPDHSRRPKRVREVVPVDQSVYTLAQERIARTFDEFDHVSVSFSGGKDSTAVLNVALEVLASDRKRWARHYPLRVVHWDEEAIPYETEEYVRRTAQRDDVRLEWMCLPVVHRNACSRRSPYWYPWAPEDRAKWCRPLPPEAITRWPGYDSDNVAARRTIPLMTSLINPPELGNCAQLLGIRADESIVRSRAVRTVGPTGLNYVNAVGGDAKNVWKVYPVYDWSTQDVWTAPAELGWDYNHAYDRQEMAGVRPYAQRCSPAFGEEPIQKLHLFAKCFPEVWDRMVDRVPGVGAAARYSTTELYGFRARPEKPADWTWGQLLTHYIEKFRPKERKHIANRIAEDIRRHYRDCGQPIAVYAPHPLTGLSWDFLIPVAMRGDLKSRRVHDNRMTSDELGRTEAKWWKKYCDELAEVIRDGKWHELGHPGPQPANVYDLMPDYAKEAYGL